MHRFDAHFRLPWPRSAVYAAWIDEATVFPPVERLVVEARVGGRYLLYMPGRQCMRGRFTSVEPGVRIHYSWQWDGDPERTDVRVEFRDAPAETPGGPDATEARIRHGDFDSPESLQRHIAGWETYVSNMDAHLAREHGDGAAAASS